MNYQAMLAQMGKWKSGATDKMGMGMGGPGRGRGGQLDMQETPTGFKSTKTQMKMDKGDIIGAIRVYGPQVKGEAKERFVKAYFEYSQNADDTLTRENIPLELRSLVGDYFDAIRPATVAKKPEGPETAPIPFEPKPVIETPPGP
jgi:hypothetical protein